MAVDVQDPSVAARKFVSRGQGAATDYQDGVRGSGNKWQEAAAASADNYRDGVQAAIARGAFARGVTEAGGSKYEQKALSVGVARFPQGIAAAGPDYQRNVAPYLEVIRSLTLSARRPKGDPANFQRVAEIGTALRRRKLGG